MKVVPHIKRKKLASDEVRVITIDRTALEELLLENLLEHKSDYFDISGTADDNICIMNWDLQQGFLTYAVMPIKYCKDGYELNFTNIRKTIGITTNSMFNPNRYRSLKLSKDFLSKGQGSTGDGSVC